MIIYQECPKCGARAYARSLYDSGYYCFPNQNGCGTKFPVNISKANGLLSYVVSSSSYLKNDVQAFSHDFYIPYNSGHGGDFAEVIISLKGRVGCDVEALKRTVSAMIKDDLDKIIDNDDKFSKAQPVVIAVPRSKPDNFWKDYELQFRPAISLGIKKSKYVVSGSDDKWIIDGTNYIVRTVETQTTHLARSGRPGNAGSPPYEGITKDTCRLCGDVTNKNIILIDDIYTKTAGIDDDCIQFLLDNGAADVTLYTLGITISPPKESSVITADNELF